MILTVTPNPAVDVVYFVEEFKMGDVHRPYNMTATAGGKGLNVARVGKIIGEETVAMGFTGGNNGAFIEEGVEKIGITNLFTKVSGETRRCVNISDKTGKSGEILEAGPEVTKEEEELFLKAFSEEVKKADIICASGSVPKGIDSNFYCKLVKIAKENGKKIIVDTSGKLLESVIEAKPYMVSPNKDELCALTGCKTESEEDIKNALFAMFEKGIELPIVTLGKDGAIALCDGKFYKFIIPAVDVKNSVGSGDSTVAGIAVGISRGMKTTDAICLGMACGIANTQFYETGFVSKELVDKYFKEIKFSEI